MTEQVAPETQPLTAILANVKVTVGDAVGLLNSLMEANADKSPTLVASLQQAIADISAGTVTEEPVTPQDSPTY